MLSAARRYRPILGYHLKCYPPNPSGTLSRIAPRIATSSICSKFLRFSHYNFSTGASTLLYNHWLTFTLFSSNNFVVISAMYSVMGRIKVCGAQNAGSSPRGPVLFSGNNPVQPSKPAVQQVSSMPIQKDLSGLTTRTPGSGVSRLWSELWQDCKAAATSPLPSLAQK